MEKGLDVLRKLLARMGEQVEQLAAETEPLEKLTRMAGLAKTARVFYEKVENLFADSY